jgi:hypothetical protein
MLNQTFMIVAPARRLELGTGVGFTRSRFARLAEFWTATEPKTPLKRR